MSPPPKSLQARAESVFRTTAAVLALAFGPALGGLAQGQPPPALSSKDAARLEWRDLGGDASYRVVQHQRVAADAHSGKECEWFLVEAGNGSQIFVGRDIGRPAIIDDLSLAVWVKSDRPGIQIAARVVLPRSTDPKTGAPLTAVLVGGGATKIGAWQRLELSGLPRLLTRQVQLMRLQHGPHVDGREAFVESLLLNVYGGAGMTNVWIGEQEITGAVAATGAAAEGPLLTPPAAEPAPGAPRENIAPLAPVRLPPVRSMPRSSGGAGSEGPASRAVPKHRAVHLVGSELRVDERPIFPRAIQYRGEPLALLQQLGFNAVWLQRTPAPELLEEAERLGLWLICPPPRGPGPIAEFGPAFDCVLAWDLGSDLTETELDAVERWAKEVRAADRRGHRPTICCPRENLRGFSRAADLLLVDRRPLGTSLELSQYAEWVRGRPLLARPGTSVWTTVQTQPSESLRQQLAASAPGAPPPGDLPVELIRLAAYTAIASGTRGAVFLSDSPLDAPDPDTRRRAMALELLNVELRVIEPWAAAGNVAASAESNRPEVFATVLQTFRARLLLPIWLAPQSQCVPPQSAANGLTLLAPGIPEDCKAYELTPGGILPLRPTRETGGMRVVLDEFGPTAQILLAHDPSIVGAVYGRTWDAGRRAAELHRHLAVAQFDGLQSVMQQIAARTPAPETARWIDAARKSLQACDRALASGKADDAAREARRAARSLRLVERTYWDAAHRTADGRALGSPVTSPAAVVFATLPQHWRLVDRLQSGRFSHNQVAGGDFEDADAMVRAGWRYYPQSPTNPPTVAPSVDLAPEAARSGRLGLRLSAVPIDPRRPPAVVESPPILFTSPTISLEAGQIACIRGWVQVPGAITGSADGLLIVDSLAGEALAERIGRTDGWQEFLLFRAAPRAGPMCGTFALSGLGEARLDDVSIQVFQPQEIVTQR